MVAIANIQRRIRAVGPPRRRLAVAAAAAALTGLLGWWYAGGSPSPTGSAGGGAPPNRGAGDAAPQAPAGGALLVFVSGAVAHPGIYRLAPAARVAEAVAAAGGVTAGADTGRLPNLAARVHDGSQINVPFIVSRGRGAAVGAARLDINTASVEELAAVPGMPAGLAEAIVEYRGRFGPFTSITQLRTDLGVDRVAVSGLRRRLVVGPVAR